MTISDGHTIIVVQTIVLNMALIAEANHSAVPRYMTRGSIMRLSRNHLRTALLCLAALVIAALADGAKAQVTSAQQSAIKQSCRSDFMSNCSGIAPGGKDALACLQKNVASLSPACQQAVSATLPAPAAPAGAQAAPAGPAPAATSAAPAPAASRPGAGEAPPPAARPAATKTVAVRAAPVAVQPTAAQQNAIKQACRSDFMSQCSGVTPGGKDALVCLQQNVARLSPACRQVVSATLPAAAKTKTAPAVTGPAAVAAPAVVVAPVAAATPQQLSAIKHTCSRDFKLHCRGIQAGGPEALGCLQRNAARLAPDCRTSVADIGDAVPVAAAPGAAPVVVVPAAAPAMRPLPPGITPAGRVLRRVIRRTRERELESQH